MLMKRVYFGNWLRDYSQGIDAGSLKGPVNAETIRILVCNLQLPPASTCLLTPPIRSGFLASWHMATPPVRSPPLTLVFVALSICRKTSQGPSKLLNCELRVLAMRSVMSRIADHDPDYRRIRSHGRPPRRLPPRRAHRQPSRLRRRRRRLEARPAAPRPRAAHRDRDRSAHRHEELHRERVGRLGHQRGVLALQLCEVYSLRPALHVRREWEGQGRGFV